MHAEELLWQAEAASSFTDMPDPRGRVRARPVVGAAAPEPVEPDGDGAGAINRRPNGLPG
jgi:hypothetical protein